MAADTVTRGAPSDDIRCATAPSRRALQAGAAPGATYVAPSAAGHSDAELLRRAALPDGSSRLKVALSNTNPRKH